jgi:transcriptional regulatory protein RtcR
MRMAARAHDGTITKVIAEEIVAELRAEQEGGAGEEYDELLRSIVGPDRLDVLDHIERVQLAHVLRVCRRSPSLAAASRVLFDKSREKKKTRNDTHRLSQHLQRYGLDWGKIQASIGVGGSASASEP